MSFSLSEVAELAVKYVNTTQRNVFLTGKAGSGKTTLLKYIVENTYKKTVVAAPTGIAAINAGGVTLHSLLQLPFGTFIPENASAQNLEFHSKLNTPGSVISQLQMSATKRTLLKEIELLIIDEVSMLRADLLDCIDLILKSVRRRKDEPFGGVQILFIGDLNQLPPVVKNWEWPLLSTYYNSAFFFESLALKASPPVFIELDKIYRQADQAFINILNRLRDNQLLEMDVEILNSHYKKDFSPEPEDGYIHITTHNRKSDVINQKELKKLEAAPYDYHAKISGDFPENMYPLPSKITLKEGAQVMFIKNDPSGEGQFYNGKIGHILNLGFDHIDVVLNDSEKVVHVKTYVWENKRYKLNGRTDEIEENVIGSFEQYPIKLAWAITVHKSQGLTFEKAILDLTDSFAPGQMYVALSRLTSLSGLVLSTPIPDHGLDPDKSLSAFARSKKEYEILRNELKHDRKNFLTTYISNAFSLSDLIRELTYHLNSFNKDEKRSIKQKYHSWTLELLQETNALQGIAEKFSRQIVNIGKLEEDNYIELFTERVSKADEYFIPNVQTLIRKITSHKKSVGSKPMVKTYSKELKGLLEMYKKQVQKIQKASLLMSYVGENKIPTKREFHVKLQSTQRGSSTQNEKEDKLTTRDVTLNLYKEGFNIEEIAQRRGLSPTTIEGHLAAKIADGAVNVFDFVDQEKVSQIITVAKEIDTYMLNEIKSRLGDEFTYGEIKMAIAFKKSSDLKEK